MDIDKTTIKDLSIFTNEDQLSIFDKCDLTLTSGGSHKLRTIFDTTLKSVDSIKDIQATIQIMMDLKSHWPNGISNGTLMVVHKFYDSPLDQIPSNLNKTSTLQYKLLHSADYSLIKYSASHSFDLIKGMTSFTKNYDVANNSLALKKVINRINKILDKEQLSITTNKKDFKDLNITEVLKFAYFIRYIYKENIYELIDLFYLLDAWNSMALAKEKYHLAEPELIESEIPYIECKELYHLLLPDPTSYDVSMQPENNFIFLTGANMAGKSTFIKAIGTAVFLSHIGMGVPAKKMSLSLFDGLLSNINVVDNLSKGESYFYNEVQRIKNTVLKITDGRKWLVLIDELFKGTNVEDAKTCSTAVIEGLIKIKSSLFILSTHLYEIGEGLKIHSNISFKYFETTVDNEQLFFSYQLQNGISNDRLGYLILKREKVIDLLDKIVPQ